MSAYHDCNIVFRCPTLLKERMKTFAEANQELLSTFIRSACLERLDRASARLTEQSQQKLVAKLLEVAQ